MEAVDAVLQGMEAAAHDPVADSGRAETDPKELASADEGVLATGKLRDPRLTPLVGGFHPTMGIFPPTSRHRPEVASR